MAAVSLRGVCSVTREDGFAVRGVTLDVPDGVVCAVIGPSGSGKTTLLRLVAGLEPVAQGSVWIGDVDVTGWLPRNRNLAWFPQEQSLYPHLDVRRNIGFPLRLRKLPHADVDERVRAEARATGVERLLRRRPATLSAGERQAAGLARATIRLPGGYLLDEPLARIDVQERARLRVELARLFHGFDVPVLLATNDQSEALALGDRIAVLRDGVIVQSGTPESVHGRPDTVFVASFVGEPGMNILPGSLESGSRATFVRVGAGAVRLVGVPARLRAHLDGQPVMLGVRPEHLRLGGEDAPLAATLERAELLGATTVLHARLDGAGATVAVRIAGADKPAPGQRVRLAADGRRVHLFDPATEQALWHASYPV